MKHLFYASLACAAILYSCSSKSSDKDSSASSDELSTDVEASSAYVVEEQPQEPSNPSQDEYGNLVYQPPFSFKAVKEELKTEYDYSAHKDVKRPRYRITFEIKVDKNGRFKGTCEELYLRWGDHYAFYGTPDTTAVGKEEISGKWSDTYLSMGEGYLKCYNLECPNFDDWSLLMLGTCEYAWFAQWPMLEAEEWNTKEAMTVSDVKVY